MQSLLALSEACVDAGFASGNLPYPLALLLYELLEVDEGRPSLVLSHKPGGMNHANFLRTTLKAQAAALVKSFSKTMSEPDAAKVVASVLAQCGFRQKTKDNTLVPVGAAAVLNWYQDREKANRPFLDIYNDTLAQIRELQALAKQQFPARTEEEHRMALIGWFAETVLMFSYRP
jgi:hypothetical protein